MARSCLAAGWISILLFVPAPANDAAGLGLDLLYRLDLLPAIKQPVKVASQSSYDRTGKNNDGFSGEYSFVRKEPEGLVLLDIKGPGVIYRIWTPTPTMDLTKFYFDGETTPRIQVPFQDLFTGKREPFVRPIVGYGAGGFYSYVPLPFEKSCKILIEAEKMRFYQINYAIYPPGSAVKTWEAKPSEAYLAHQKIAQELWASPGSDISAYTARNADACQVFRIHQRLEPGGQCPLWETKKPGRIVGIRLSPARSFSGKDRALVLRAYWDGDSQPAIVAPVGDLFGYGWGEPAVQSLLVGTNKDVNYLYFPMPFDASARIEIVSERMSGPPIEIDAEIVVDPTPRSAHEGKFYALWRRENPTTKGKPFTFIETDGCGHLVGCIQQSQGFESGNTYYFEGDDQTTIDGELAIHGTGSEDFYNGGWYDVPGRWETRRSFPLSGCLGYQKHLGRTGGYRIMIGDAYAFRKSILHTIEHAPTANSLINDYCGTAFLYLDQRPTCPFELPPVKNRGVVDLEKVVFATWWNVPIHAWSFQNARLSRIHENLDGKDLRFLSLQAEGMDSFGHPFIAFTCELPAAGRYRISVEAARGPHQGKVQLFWDEAPVADPVDFYAAEREMGEPQSMGVLALEEGPNTILFKIVGKHDDSGGLRFDLRNIICEKVD
ncbi:MAG: DUF2961 domain-containing protein [Pirellulales bacterium]|nr:DUF2961 domain-containing protein [Pirellulales bacterium]